MVSFLTELLSSYGQTNSSGVPEANNSSNGGVTWCTNDTIIIPQIIKVIYVYAFPCFFFSVQEIVWVYAGGKDAGYMLV